MKTPASIVHSLVSAAILAAGATAVQAGSPERVFIEYAPGAGAMVRDAIAAEDGLIHYRFDRIGALAVSLDELAAERVARHPKVLSVEPDPKRYLAGRKLSVDDDADPQTLPYGIDRVQAPLVWAEGFEGEGVTVCIIDTGLYVGHEDIAVSEARKLGIPVIGVVDTNNDPEDIDYVIPGNDDAIRAVQLYVQGASAAILEGRAAAATAAAAGRSETQDGAAG